MVLWQSQFIGNQSLSGRTGRSTASVGLSPDIHNYFYFSYYFNVFPVGAIPEGASPDNMWRVRAFDTPPFLPLSQSGADQFVRDHGNRLIMDFSQPATTIRSGEFSKLFLFLPHAWLSGTPMNPSVTDSSVIFFNAALFAILVAFWAEGLLLLGILIVLLVGSDPFQLYEVYLNDNINGFAISGILFGLAVHLRYMSGRRGADRWAWLTAAFMGILSAFLLNIRSEAGVVLLAAPFVWLLIPKTSRRKRLALVGLLIVSTLATERLLAAYWNRQFDRAIAFVRKHGGHPYPGPYNLRHSVWHPIFMGLGDYGYDRGYRWDDRVAFSYALPRLRDQDHKPYPYPEQYFYLDDTYDSEGWYRVYPADLPGYDRILQAKVLQDVRDHRSWYLNVLYRRLRRVLSATTPLSLSCGYKWWSMDFSGMWALPTLLLLICLRKWFLAGVIAFTLPLSATAIMIYAFRGTPRFNIFHLMTFAVWVYLLVNAFVDPESRSYWWNLLSRPVRLPKLSVARLRTPIVDADAPQAQSPTLISTTEA